ncbi:MAG: YdcF family protein [Oscillospiraceae bacterium]|nr:YdcF family protein [Oscillospiraceae bacterium]
MDHIIIGDISNFIFMNDVPKKSDIIFIPGTSKSAITEKAARLYRLGYAKYVLPSGMYSSKNGKFASDKIDNPKYEGDYKTEFEFCKNILIKNGVPESAVICEDRATNSMENAEFSARIIKDLEIEIKTAILCCQSFHARRAFMSYSRHFPNTKIFVVPTDTQDITKYNWFLHEKSYRIVMSELTKCGKYFMDQEKEI